MQVGNHPFLDLDDYDYVVNNSHLAGGITGDNIIWAFTSVDYYNWHPITWLSHMADVQFYGMDPRGHHLTSVVIHSFTALFIFLFFLRSTGALWPSYLVAALFALHPLHVESVAWVAERRDVLSALFMFLTLFMYSSYVVNRTRSMYVLTLFAFVLGLMSKQTLVTLPLIMLLTDFWPLNRYRHDESLGTHQLLYTLMPLIKEKIPFFLCSFFASIITLFANNKAGTIIDIATVPFSFRIENALIAYVKYIGKTLWPSDLAVFYPYPSYIPFWQSICALFILLLLSAAAIRTGRRYPYVSVGWFWFIITLVPVIGIIQVGGQSMADRYSYISITGLSIVAAWGIQDLTNRLKYQQRILALLTGATIIISAALTWQQLGYWRNSIALFRHTLQVTTDNFNIHNFLGNTLRNSGNWDEAILEYQEALRIEPKAEYLHKILGIIALQARGDLLTSIQEYMKAIQTDPNNATVIHYNMATALEAHGYLDSAIYEYQEVLRLDPVNRKAYDGLERAFTQKRMQSVTKN